MLADMNVQVDMLTMCVSVIQCSLYSVRGNVQVVCTASSGATYTCRSVQTLHGVIELKSVLPND